MSLQQEAYEKIINLPDDSVRLIIALIDKIQLKSEFSEIDQKDAAQSIRAFQEMEALRSQSPFPKDINCDEIIEEAIHNKYENFT